MSSSETIGPRWLDYLAPFLLALVVPTVIAVGGFFTLQADVKHLENRLQSDEALLFLDLNKLESRLRVVELDSSSRLTGIETRLISIEQYMLQIQTAIVALNTDDND